MTAQDAIFKAKLFVSDLKKTGLKISDAYVFGSYATGRQGLGSDIDVCVVSPDFGKNIVREAVKISMISDKIDMMIEVHPMNKIDFADKYNHLAYEVKKYGVSVL